MWKKENFRKREKFQNGKSSSSLIEESIRKSEEMIRVHAVRERNIRTAAAETNKKKAGAVPFGKFGCGQPL